MKFKSIAKDSPRTIREERRLSASEDADDFLSDDDAVFTENAQSGDEQQEPELNQPRYGVLFDIDGVIARGSKPLQAAKDMMPYLLNPDNSPRVPIAFCTNGCNKDEDKAKALSEWLGVEITRDQVIHAQTPLRVFKSYHDKYTLVLGQGPIREIASDLGFTNICTIDDIIRGFPLLDMVDHANRKKVANGYQANEDVKRVEAIVMFGEPNKWESHLQLLIDLLVTDGYPTMAPEGFPEKHLPILACNMDLVFMAEACMPRFGNGSFLVCLESLYKKITGYDLQYTALVGKPSEITYRYAEHVITMQAKKMGFKEPIMKLYFIGDNAEVDIVGANLYDQYMQRQRRRSFQMFEEMGGMIDITRLRNEIAISKCRAVPSEAIFSTQTVRKIDGILVGTGVFDPEKEEKLSEKQRSTYRGHRDFDTNAYSELRKPTIYVDDVCEALKYIIGQERMFGSENIKPQRDSLDSES
ncbi:haloacid dehalogenase-like hydrolase domain-containing 5 isoform X2 [Lineus longissimus]|uniref:haloacid dehalogenase-like hydrolase domain-containing 5 isoform X2 n=1 Tax=Lineus longissimus TaxID=88925 RepID=UPI002B4C9FFA